MKRGDIYYANLSPTVGHEINKKRPVVIISNNINNKFSDTVTVIPVTSNITKVYPFEVRLLANTTGLSKDSKAQCHQIRTISKTRLNKSKLGAVREGDMHLIANAVSIHLDL